MDSKKQNHKITRNIFHYLIIAIAIAAVVATYYFKNPINDFFMTFGDTTQYGNLNQTVREVLCFVPNIIYSIQVGALMFALVFLVNTLIKQDIGLTFKGKTLVKVILSIIKWIIIVSGIMWILAIYGINTSALLISAGVITLVVGLSAQSLISDVLAGLFIVIEGEYLIGDIVVIDGYRGKVKSIGVRTTAIEDIGGNVKIINNSEIKTVINLTNNKSLAKVTMYIASSEDLRKVEDTLVIAIPSIMTKLEKYGISDLTYKGVNGITSDGMALIFTAHCYEEDIYDVERQLYREFKYVMDENNISGNEPLVIHDRSEEFNERIKEYKEKEVVIEELPKKEETEELDVTSEEKE